MKEWSNQMTHVKKLSLICDQRGYAVTKKPMKNKRHELEKKVTKVYEGNTVHLRLGVLQHLKPHFVHGR